MKKLFGTDGIRGLADHHPITVETGRKLGQAVVYLCIKQGKDPSVVIGRDTRASGEPLAKALMSGFLSAAPVGDRYVMEEMRAHKADLGGEESGHTIFFNHHTTGDGLLSALHLVSAMQTFEQPLSELSKLMNPFPQILINVPVERSPDISEVRDLVRAIKKAEQGLGESGRVLVRYSGTEPVCRVMVEGENEDEAKAYVGEIADTVRKALGY